jgi:25S rRNA (uracil2634-N3)-methyltransferase
MYNSEERILLLGEGNFSFGVALMAQLGTCRQLVCSTIMSESQVRATYREGGLNLDILSCLDNVHLLFGLDATKLCDTLVGKQKKEFDKIVFHFPLKLYSCAAYIYANQDFLISVLRSTSAVLAPHGQIHITLCNLQPVEWELRDLVELSSIQCLGSEPFRVDQYPGYEPRCENCDSDWFIHPNTARTLIFAHTPTSDPYLPLDDSVNLHRATAQHMRTLDSYLFREARKKRAKLLSTGRLPFVPSGSFGA